MKDDNQNAVTRAAFVLGFGFSAFFDGIVLHQLLQWHHMVSHRHPPNTLANLQLNTLADGLFHLAAWIATTLGIFLLWRARSRATGPLPSRLFPGAMLMGWGAFNILENTVNHFILQVHHVRDDVSNKLTWDIGFILLMGFLPFFLGLALSRAAQRSTSGAH
jgi:uncharacterized membrane protein